MRNELDKSFMFKGLKKDIAVRYGQEKSEEIWNRGGEIIKTYPEVFPTVSYKLAGQYVFPLAAIYSAMLENDIDQEEAVSFLIDYGGEFGEKIRKMFYRVTSIPGVSALIWKNIDKMMHKAGSKEMGYESTFYPKTDTRAGMDVLVCPLHEALKTMGMPEIAPTICAMDKIYMTGLRGIAYQRTKSVAEGDDCCDYRLTRIKK